MTATVTNLEARFSIDTSDIDRGINHVTKQFHSLSNSAQSAVSGFSFGRVFEFATGGLLANGISNVVSSLGDLGATALNSYAYTERLESSLQSLAAREFLKSGAAADMNQALEMGVAKAEELSTWIEKLAVQSPFKQSEVADSFRQAMNFGFAADEAQRLTKALIDFTAGSGNTGETMKRVAFALGQIRVNGRASADDLNQLTDAGLDARTILAEAFGVTTAELRKMVSDGLVPADEAIEAITKSLENDFGGAALRQANSFSGLLSSLSDIKELGLRDFFGPMLKAAQPALQGFVEMLGSDSIKNAISSWGQSLGDFVGGAIEKAKNLMSILSSSNPFAAIGESLGADVQVLGSITSVKWGEFIGVLNWNDYVISLRWKDFIATFNWKDSVTNLDWKGFIFAFDWNDWVGTFTWGSFISVVDWSNWIYLLSWGSFVTKIDLWNKVAGLQWGDFVTSIDLSQDVFTLNWGDFVAKIDLGNRVASLVWGTYVAAIDWNLYATIISWGDYIGYWDWSTAIPELHWSDHTVSLKWGEFIGVFNWSSWVATIVWGDYIDRISWSDVLPVINAWSDYIPQLLWVNHVAILRWNEFMGVFDWNTYVLTLSWGTYIQKLSWDSIVTAISDWSAYISKLSWTEFIIQMLDWGTWIPALVWNTVVKAIDLATYVVPLLWSELITGLEWLTVVAPVVWNDYLEPLLWSAMVKVLEWNSYVSSLTWDDFLDALSWVSYVSSLTWDSFVSKLEWPKLITGLDLRSLIPSFPGWDYFFNWFGASAPSSTVVVNNGPGVTGNTPPSSPTVSPTVTPTPPGRSLGILNQQQPNVVINVYATVNNEIDATQLAYQVAETIKRRRL